MATRLQLQTLLELVLESENVYFQPPENIKMNYPAVVYKPSYEFREFADNLTYRLKDQYELTIIDRNPDSPARHRIRKIQGITFVRFFEANKLNHYVYSLYY